MLVTLITDASHYEKPSVGAWAGRVRTSKGQLSMSGLFVTPVHNSATAEAAAIANALHQALQHPVCAGATAVLIQTDHTGVVTWVTERRAPPKYWPVVKHILQTAERHKVTLRIKHIKGHVGRGTPRNYLHNWCDIESRRLARAEWEERVYGKTSKPID